MSEIKTEDRIDQAVWHLDPRVVPDPRQGPVLGMFEDGRCALLVFADARFPRGCWLLWSTMQPVERKVVRWADVYCAGRRVVIDEMGALSGEQEPAISGDPVTTNALRLHLEDHREQMGKHGFPRIGRPRDEVLRWGLDRCRQELGGYSCLLDDRSHVAQMRRRGTRRSLIRRQRRLLAELRLVEDGILRLGEEMRLEGEQREEASSRAP